MTSSFDEQLLPISGLQHIVFCERQCALIHVERVWSENALTAEGQLLHRRTDEGGTESRTNVRLVRSLDLVSHKYGLVGKSDVVEFRAPSGTKVTVPRVSRLGLTEKPNFTDWQVTPIEYKRGRPKTHKVWGDCDRVQLCAQSLCLEEMLNITIASALLFYGEKRRRYEVEIDRELREKTFDAIKKFHLLIRQTKLPPPVNDRRCTRCSLREQCMPNQTASIDTAGKWIAKQLARIAEAPD